MSNNLFFPLYIEAICNKWTGLAIVNQETADLIRKEDPRELLCHVEPGGKDSETGLPLFKVWKIREWTRDQEPIRIREQHRKVERELVLKEKERINLVHINFHAKLKQAIAKEIEAPNLEDKMVLEMFESILGKKKWTLCEGLLGVKVPSEVKGS